jgi:sugar/nucleoside kinase (ribokinase family)
MSPDMLIAGHIAKDVTADGWRPGGGVLYAAAQAERLGLRVAAVTACSSEIDPASLLPGVEWHVLPSAATTTFENVYRAGIRQQRLLDVGDQIRLEDIPPHWLEAPLVLLTSLFHEIDGDIAPSLAARGAIVGLGAQGWLRSLEDDRVRPAPFEPAPSWLAGEAVFVSQEDLSEPERVKEWRGRVPVVALTRAHSGCTVWDAAGRHEVSAAAVAEVDPTGAGDVFAVSFLVRYAESRDAVAAARFAAAAAALSVLGEGISAIAGRGEIEALLRAWQVKVAR